MYLNINDFIFNHFFPKLFFFSEVFFTLLQNQTCT